MDTQRTCESKRREPIERLSLTGNHVKAFAIYRPRDTHSKGKDHTQYHQAAASKHVRTTYPLSSVPVLPQHTLSLLLLGVVQDPDNSNPSILTNLLTILTDEHSAGLSLIVRIARILQMTNEAEVDWGCGEPANLKTRRSRPVEFVAEVGPGEGVVRWGCHDCLLRGCVSCL